MPYLLLIHEPIGQRAARGEAEGRVVYDRMLGFARDLKQRGLLLATESLASQDHAVKVRSGEGRAMALDGPFAEAKEMVGGFFLVDCQTREEAVALAQQCPAAGWATVEVRATGPCFDI